MQRLQFICIICIITKGSLDYIAALFFFFLLFSRSCHTVFHSGYTNLNFHKQYKKIIFSPQLHQHLFTLVFLIGNLTGVRRYLIMVLIHSSLMIIMMTLLVTKACLTLCDPMNCRPPGSSVHGVSQARILKWVTISSSRGSS